MSYGDLEKRVAALENEVAHLRFMVATFNEKLNVMAQGMEPDA